MKALQAWTPFAIDLRVIETAWEVQDRHRLSFWDALVVATAVVNGCKRLLTEDLQHGQNLRGVTVLNPFVTAPDASL